MKRATLAALLMTYSLLTNAGGLASVAPAARHDGPTPQQPGGTAPAPPDPAPKAPAAPSTIKVEVDLVPVEVSVRDPHGKPLENLTRDDFRIFEDGVEQQIRYFSHAELPLALALVLDSSTSVAAALKELREGAREALSLLKPDDQIALFSFADKPEKVESLSTDRSPIPEDIAAISPGGGTNITDALYEAATYLGREAPNRRHVIVLVSDNEPSDKGAHDDPQVIRTALETQTVIYSVKVGYFEHSKWYYLTHPESTFGSVDKVCRHTGGAVIDSRTAGSVTSALATVIAWLKQGYSLAYSSTNRRQDGTYRKIEVRLAPHSSKSANKYSVYARQGYYAPLAPAGSTDHRSQDFRLPIQ